ncbi:MAG: hypothetical protein NTY98_05150 [Verrucomicrobia bacterium]|nr:hypothetical protein [Verrucomicrobiota bacterium]
MNEKPHFTDASAGGADTTGRALAGASISLLVQYGFVTPAKSKVNIASAATMQSVSSSVKAGLETELTSLLPWTFMGALSCRCYEQPWEEHTSWDGLRDHIHQNIGRRDCCPAGIEGTL